MLFNSYIFLLFAGLVLPLFFAIPRRYRNHYLLLVSYLFYGYWDWRFCGLLAFSTVSDFFLGQQLYAANTDRQRKFFLWTSIIVNLGVLFSFKYFNFFIDSFQGMVAPLGGNLDYLHLTIILPVGISFYTFQTMSYTIDIYRRNLTPARSLIDFGLFVAFFPQLVAGPIEKAKHLLPQIINKPLPTKLQIREGITLIVIGFFKKVMIGDTTGRFVDRVFGEVDAFSSGELLTALVLFSIQIYADFSGYSSIARGLAKILGIELIRNFEQPYLSASISEFWRRWHISLGAWIKDYIYIPLGGNRKGELRTYVNLMITMVLIGLWHGASWTFVVYGLLNGIYLVVHRFLLNGSKIAGRYSYKGVRSFLFFVGSVIFTNVLVMITRIFFRSPTFADAAYFVTKIVQWESSPITYDLVIMSVTFAVMTFALDIIEYYTRRHDYILQIKHRAVRYGVLTSLFLVVLVYMFQYKPLPFIYFQF